jgi:hypothetical protein
MVVVSAAEGGAEAVADAVLAAMGNAVIVDAVFGVVF